MSETRRRLPGGGAHHVRRARKPSRLKLLRKLRHHIEPARGGCRRECGRERGRDGIQGQCPSRSWGTETAADAAPWFEPMIPARPSAFGGVAEWSKATVLKSSLASDGHSDSSLA